MQPNTFLRQAPPSIMNTSLLQCIQNRVNVSLTKAKLRSYAIDSNYNFRIMRAGFPPITQLPSTKLFVTTAPAPTIV